MHAVTGFLDRLKIELRMVGQLQQAGLKNEDALAVGAQGLGLAR